MRVYVQNIVIANEWVTAELLSDALALKGWRYVAFHTFLLCCCPDQIGGIESLQCRFANAYCWVTRWENGKIVEVHAYVDSAMTTRLIEEAEM